MTTTLDGLDFELEDFVGADGLGHTSIQPATVGGSGQIYDEEVLFPDRVFNAMLNQQQYVFTPAVVAETGTAKTLALTDGNVIVACSNVSGLDITIPLNASVAFAIGTCIVIERLGSGAVDIIATSGVTLNGSNGGTLSIATRYFGCYLRKTATDAWIAIGNLE